MQLRSIIGIVLAMVLIAGIPGTSVLASGMDEGSTGAYPTVLRADAADKVLSEVLNRTTEGKWVYSYRYPVPPETVLKTWYGSVSLPRESGWIFFIDDMPGENWAHPCRYVFVSSYGVLSVYDSHGPPELFTEWDRLSMCHENLLIDTDDREFNCLVIGDRMLYWHQRVIGDAIVEGDFILYEFNHRTGELISVDEHTRSGVPEEIPTVISKEEAESMVPGMVRSIQLRILSPEGSAFPVQPPPAAPCWVVQSVVDDRTEITIIDAVHGKILELYPSYVTTGGTQWQTPSTAPTQGTEAIDPSPTVAQEVPGFCGIVAIGGLLAGILNFLKKNE